MKLTYPSDMKTKWFDTTEIRVQESLTPEQIDYLRKPSVTIFGPFNVFVRRHWDMLLTAIGLSVFVGIITGLLLPMDLLTSGPNGHLYTFLAGLPGFIIALVIYGYFGIKHGRRLAWNRQEWVSFEVFEKSEESWRVWGYVGIALFVVGLIAQFIPVLVGGSA
jgi:hypothetical protein